MLNWIAYWVGSYALRAGRAAAERHADQRRCRSRTTSSRRRSCPSSGATPSSRASHIGIFIAVGALVAYWLILSRTTLGFRVRAVGPQPRGGPLRRHQRRRAATSWRWRSPAPSRASAAPWTSWAGSSGSAPSTSRPRRSASSASRSPCSGATRPSGVAFAALLFGALLYGTSSRSLDPTSSTRSLAGNLTTMIQALVLLFIGADVLILYLWHRRGRPRPPPAALRAGATACRAEAAAGVVAAEHATSQPGRRRRCSTGPATGRSRTSRAGPRPPASPRVALAVARVLDRRAPGDGAARRRADRDRGRGRSRLGAWTAWQGQPAPRDHRRWCWRWSFGALGVAATHLERREPGVGLRLVGAHGLDAPLRDAADLRGGRRHVLGAQRAW